MDTRLLKVREDFRSAYGRYLEALKIREKQGRKAISFDDYLWLEAEKRVKENRRESNG